VTLCAVALLAAGASGEGCRKHVAKVTEYGAVGDGKRLNTAAFAKAVADLSKHADDGGAALVVPRGRWLTGPFNLTSSHFTLFLDEGAEILASQVRRRSSFPSPVSLPVIKPGVSFYLCTLCFCKHETARV
jgi:polygalacturonase